MQALRAENGCPWDAQQTAESLTPYILEEACELVDAIESGDQTLILEELGDLLLQVVFQAQIFSEQQLFDFYDVAEGIAEKLVRRHPHVFVRQGSQTITRDLDKQWEEIKSAEENNKKYCLADHLPSKLPALQRAQKLVSRARKANQHELLPCSGFDIALPKQLDEESLGKILFDLVKAAHAAGLDAEAALRKTTASSIRCIDDISSRV